MPDPISTAFTAYGHASSSNYGYGRRRSSFSGNISQPNFQHANFDYGHWQGFESPSATNTFLRSNSFVSEGTPQGIETFHHRYMHTDGQPSIADLERVEYEDWYSATAINPQVDNATHTMTSDPQFSHEVSGPPSYPPPRLLDSWGDWC